MKTQISRLSPHQNGKVFGVLTALMSLIFVIPMAVLFSFLPAGVDANGDPVSQPSALFFAFLPIVYLVTGYLMTAAGCALYNMMFKHLGGIEYESRDQ
jgi:ABC-type Na+ efflux pump permease subunit